MRVVILNAPPNAGKDVGCQHLIKVFGGHHREFKGMLFKATKAAFGVPDSIWEQLYTREYKEIPSAFLINNGEYISPRQALINTSENVVKPLFGQDAFGKALANSLGEGYNFISDGGFPDEIKPVVEKVGASNVLIIRVSRPECTFEGDSRNYIPYNQVDKGVTIVDVENSGTEGQYFDKLENTVKDWLR